MMHSRKVIIARPSCICVYVPSREFVPADPAANAATRALNTDRRVSGVTVMHFLLSNSGAAACPIATGTSFPKHWNVALTHSNFCKHRQVIGSHRCGVIPDNFNRFYNKVAAEQNEIKLTEWQHGCEGGLRSMAVSHCLRTIEMLC